MTKQIAFHTKKYQQYGSKMHKGIALRLHRELLAQLRSIKPRLVA